MSRICDWCKKEIKLGDKHIEVRFIGLKNLERIFGLSSVDFCSLTCMVSKFTSKVIPQEVKE